MHPVPLLGSGEETPKGLAVAKGAAAVLRGWEGLARAESAWDRLDQLVPCPLSHRIWAATWVRALGAGDRLQVIVVPGGGACAALVRRGGPFGYLSLPGAEELGEPTVLPYADEASLVALCRALARLSWPLRLDRVPADAPLLPALAAAYRRHGVLLSRPAKPYPYLPLDASWTEPEGHLSSRRRSDLRRARRNAERMGALQHEFLSPSPAEVDPLLDEVFQVEAASWKGRSGTALACDAVTGGFFREWSRQAALRGALRVGRLRVAERTAAVQLAVEHGARYWLLKVGYDEAFAQASPGILLLCESLRWCASRGLSSYEFLGGVAPWIQVWTPHERACVSVSAYPLNLRGLSSLSARAISHAARAAGRVWQCWTSHRH
jgi:CelD/BcsL family acetyltransferase involved in cellulose biosynthesis